MLYFPMMAIGPIIQVVTPAVAERMGAKQYGRVADLLRKAFSSQVPWGRFSPLCCSWFRV